MLKVVDKVAATRQNKGKTKKDLIDKLESVAAETEQAKTEFSKSG